MGLEGILKCLEHGIELPKLAFIGPKLKREDRNVGGRQQGEDVNNIYSGARDDQMQREEAPKQKPQEKKETILEEESGRDYGSSGEKVIPFRVITGGKGPPGTIDWLTPLPLHTSFLAQHRKEKAVGLFDILWKGRQVIFLRAHVRLNISREDEYEGLYVNPSTWCLSWDLLETLE